MSGEDRLEIRVTRTGSDDPEAEMLVDGEPWARIRPSDDDVAVTLLRTGGNPVTVGASDLIAALDMARDRLAWATTPAPEDQEEEQEEEESGPSHHVVEVSPNADPDDPEEIYHLGEFPSVEEATAACRRIVDEFLEAQHDEGQTADELLSIYRRFGETPRVITSDPDCSFSAWTYAEERCRELCAD